MRTGMTQACTRMSAKAVSDWGGIPANSSRLNTCHSPSSHLLRGCCGGWSRSGGRKAPATPLGAIAAFRNILLLGCYFTVTVTWQKQNIIMLHEKKNENKNTLVAANLQASASEMQQTSLIWVCLGDKAQDVLKSAPWECKSEQLCQAWGASTALPEQARAQQFLKQQPVSSCYQTYPAPALQPLGSSTAACRVLWWRKEGDERAPRLTSRFCGFV